MVGMKMCVYFTMPLVIFKTLSLMGVYMGTLEMINLGSLNGSLILLTGMFTMLAIKPILSSSSPLIMSLLIFFHGVAFLTSDMLMVLIISDVMICWITLGFGLNHTSMKELTSNMYLVYYVMIPSTPLLMMVLSEYFKGKSTSLISYYGMDSLITFSGVGVGFLILLSGLAKLPVFGLHYWLPKAHVQAPTILSMILAGLSLKIGLFVTSFVMINTSMPIAVITNIVAVLLVGMLVSTYTGTSATDSKVFLAYCSVSHMTGGCIGVGLMAILSFKGAWLIGLGHCLSSPLLFYIAGNTQYGTGSRVLLPSKGIKLGWAGIILLMLLLMDLPFPPTFSFWGEVTLLTTLHCMYSLLSCFMIISLVVLLRGYEQMFTNMRGYMCTSVMAGFIGSVLTLILGVMLI
uniref:NADH-ubiquinone oxidoreductase chain 4 n=1 Tax=Salpa fusiformis TaxID=942554 RepID=A0A2Z5U4Z5_9UROC|nr:NADH dehydrogenase subunit 4 [Salpa fusiformis]